MSSNDDGATKSNKIGDALVTALGFEPTDGESQRQAEISEQMSDTGFTVTDVLDRDDDGDDVDDFDDEVVDEDEDLTDDDELDDELDDDEFDDSELDDDELVDESDDFDNEDDDDDDDESDDGVVDEADDYDDFDDEADELADDDDDESDDPLEAFVDSDEADASIAGVDESDDDASDEADDDDSSSPAAESEDVETVIDSVVDSTEESASSNGVSVNPGSSGFFSSRRGGFGRSGSKEKKVYADTAFPGVESDPDITLIPDSPAITGEHDVVRIDADEPTVVQTRDEVEKRGALDTVPSLGNLTGWRPGGRRLQARKVRRVVRHIDPWSVLTFSVLFFLCLFAALLLASVLVWNVAEEAGTIENVENFILELGDYEEFEIDGEDIFRAAVAIMGVFTLAASVMVVLLTVMFNLLSDLLGGIRITVIEEETVRVRPRKQLQPADTELLE